MTEELLNKVVFGTKKAKDENNSYLSLYKTGEEYYFVFSINIPPKARYEVGANIKFKEFNEDIFNEYRDAIGGDLVIFNEFSGNSLHFQKFMKSLFPVINTNTQSHTYKVVDNYVFLMPFIDKICVVSKPHTQDWFPKWQSEKEKYLFKGTITNQNLRMILPNEIVLEFDHKENNDNYDFNVAKNEAETLIEKVKKDLISKGIFFRITSHDGKSPHIRFIINGLENEEHEVRKTYKSRIVKMLTQDFKFDNVQIDESLIGTEFKLLGLENQPHFKAQWNGAIEKIIFENISGKIPELQAEMLADIKKEMEKGSKYDEQIKNIDLKETDINFELLLEWFNKYYLPGVRNQILMGYGGLCHRLGLDEAGSINVLTRIIRNIKPENINKIDPDKFLPSIINEIKYCFKRKSEEVAVKHFIITSGYEEKVYYELLECFNVKDLIMKVIEVDILAFNKTSSIIDIEKMLKKIIANVKDESSARMLVEAIATKTGKGKKTLKDAYKDLKPVLSSNSYKFNYEEHGIYFGKTIFVEATRSYEFQQISDFKVLERQKNIDIDLFNGQPNVSERFYAEILLKKDADPVSVKKSGDFASMLYVARNKSSYCITNEDTSEFINLVENLPLIEKNAVSVYGFYEKKYYEPKQYDCYRMVNKKVGEGRKDERENGYIDANYKEFVNLKCNQEVVKKCIETLNIIPRDEKEAEIWKIVMSWSVASCLKLELRRLNCSIYPMLILIGDHDTGKTKINKVSILDIWNSKSRPSTDFGGVAGARIRDLPCDCRPICYQELEDFHKNWIPMLKEGMTAGKFTISRGSKHDRIEEHFYQNLAIDTNNLKIDNIALENRAIIINKKSPTNKINNEALLTYLEENVIHLGKYLYDNFVTLNTEEIWNEAKKYIYDKYIVELNKRENVKEGRRMTEKLATIRFGEMILTKFGVLPNVTIDYFNLYKDDEVEIVNRKLIISDIIKRRIRSIEIRDGQNILTISQIAKKDFPMTENIFYQLHDKHGIGITKSGEIILLADFVTFINKELESLKATTFASFKQLAKDIGINEDKIISHRLVVDKDTNKITISKGLMFKHFEQIEFEATQTPNPNPKVTKI